MGVTIGDGRFVPTGTALTDQRAVDNLPPITDNYPFKDLNKEVVHVNSKLAEGYNKIDLT